VRLLTKNGSRIERCKGIVGKKVGSKIYLHRSYVDFARDNNVIPKWVSNALLVCSDKTDYRWNCLMVDLKSRTVRLDQSPDFNTAREPMVGKCITFDKFGNRIRRIKSRSIWHHKWLWVMDKYRGFDVQESIRWSAKWIARFDKPAKGSLGSFSEQLKMVGLK